MVPSSGMANSRNSRPTTSPMNSNGCSTAISELASEMMVKAYIYVRSIYFAVVSDGMQLCKTVNSDPRQC
jgi:hypothetical protein